MADDTPETRNPDLARSLKDSGIDTVKGRGKENKALYKVVGSSRIPVSTKMGAVWRSRRDQASSKRKTNGLQEAWEQAIQYYRNDQLAHRHSAADGEAPGNEATGLIDSFTETENIVFANVNAMLPSLYAKNPVVEITAEKEENNEAAVTLETLLNVLARYGEAPRVNLKPKARRCVVLTLLTNRAYIEVGYNFKDQSSDQALEELQRLSTELQKAKTQKEIETVEGRIEALEQRVDLLLPSGPFARVLNPDQVLIDPNGEMDDLSDAQWVMTYEFMSTALLRALYMKETEQQPVSIFAPTHVLRVEMEGNSAIDDMVNNFSLLDDQADNSFQSFGFTSEDAFQMAQRTKVWKVWDKRTRRVLLFHDKDWKWPIWVWDDPYHLENFYPQFPLSFHTNPTGGESKGEVTYYLDQQDAVNEINSEQRQARQWARRNLVYDKNSVSKEDVEAMLRGGKGNDILGVNLPEGADIKKIITAVLPPSAQFMQLFDKAPKLEAINRISSVQDIQRGVEFKVNTTNDAVQAYESANATRVDEKIDAVEDFVGKVFWAVGQMCLQNMPPDQVADIIGIDKAQNWQNMQADEIKGRFSFQIVGGSTVKPTSREKKKEALQVGQIVGQFARSTPAAVLISLKLLERSFDDINIGPEDWQLIQQSIQAQLQRGNSTGGGQEPGQSQPQGGGDPTAAVQLASQRGVPPQQAAQRVAQLARGR